MKRVFGLWTELAALEELKRTGDIQNVHMLMTIRNLTRNEKTVERVDDIKKVMLVSDCFESCYKWGNILLPNRSLSRSCDILFLLQEDVRYFEAAGSIHALFIYPVSLKDKKYR